MIKFIQRTGFIDNQILWKSVLKDLGDNGFKIISIDGAAQVGTTIPDALKSFVIEATATVDMLAVEQPWRIAVKVSAMSTEVFIATPNQISDIGDISKRTVLEMGTTRNIPDYMGAIGKPRPKTLISGATADDASVFFWYKGKSVGSSELDGTMQFDKTQNLKETDASAMPVSYTLSISDHGIAMHFAVEGYDGDGCRQAWLCVQRAVDSTGAVVISNKAPLFAIWSHNGGGDATSNVLQADGIQRMTVRESDIAAPSRPVSAVQHSADAFSVMNPLQQVPFAEDGKFDFRLPQGFNTHRHSYSYGIDMIGYASADVISNGIPIDVQVYGEVGVSAAAKKRRYRALSANSPNNTGMRLFMLEALDASAV